jgi:hypothetical protein
MRKLLLALVLCLASVGTSFAQNNIEGMRSLTIYSLLQYGNQLYDRGDYSGAGAVFAHILTFDPKQPQALKYLKEMGYSGVDVGDLTGLKKAIDVKKQIIEKLQSQIQEMKANIASPSKEDHSNEGRIL